MLIGQHVKVWTQGRMGRQDGKWALHVGFGVFALWAAL
jgi:hypothetical protein